MYKTKKYTREEICGIALNSKSYRNFYINLGYSPNSGSYLTIAKKIIEKHNIDITHFTGRAWNKNIVNKDMIFKKGCKVKSEKLKRALVKIRGHKCENCNLKFWMGKLIPLENHHIDGNPLNNLESNLMLLCPNCHSFTENFRNKSRAPCKETS